MLVKAVQQCLRYAGCRSLLQFDEVQEKRNRFVRITNGLFSDEYGSQYGKPTHSR